MAKKGHLAWNKGKIEWRECKKCKNPIRSWRKYCSIICKTKDRMKPILLNKECVVCKNKFITNLSNKHKRCCSDGCAKIQSGKSKSGKNHPLYGRRYESKLKGKPRFEFRGENNPNWRGGSSKERSRLMGQVEYKLWRIAVFTRDNYVCQKCFTRGGKLQADHIKPWVLYPDLRYAIDNGRTLCIKCHRETETWGGRAIYKKVERILG